MVKSTLPHEDQTGGDGSLHHRVSRRSFLTAILLVIGGSDGQRRLIQRTADQTTQRAQASANAHSASPCPEALADIFDVAATVEALSMTLYYRAIKAYGDLATESQQYLKAMLAAERAHYHSLLDGGAHPLVTAFCFPQHIFDFGNLPLLLATVDTVETATIGMYLAAVRRCGELGDARLAEEMGQILSVEAEHRVLGREIAADAPPPPNNLCFAPSTVDCVADVPAVLAPFISGGAGFSSSIAQPTDAQIDAILGGIECTPIAPAPAATCADPLKSILDIAATAEALGITFYYGGIRGKIFGQLSEQRQWYFQAALDEERNHLRFLQQNGAQPAATTFHFPAAVFDDLTQFLGVLDTLENAFLGAYLAATQRFAELGQPLLAEIAGQILSVEAEHRVLGRIVAGAVPPNDRCMQPVPFKCVAEAQQALMPFIAGGTGYPLGRTLPTERAIDLAVDRFGCASVPLATSPLFNTFLPLINHS